MDQGWPGDEGRHDNGQNTSVQQNVNDVSATRSLSVTISCVHGYLPSCGVWSAPAAVEPLILSLPVTIAVAGPRKPPVISLV